MKFFIILSSLLIGIILGRYNGLTVRKSIYWQLFVFLIMAVNLGFIFIPEITCDIAAVKSMPQYYMSLSDFSVNAKMNIDKLNVNGNYASICLVDGRDTLTVESSKNNFISKLNPDNYYRWNLSFNSTTKGYRLNKKPKNIALLSYPFIPGLGEKIRLISFHVPVAWVAVLAYLLSMIFSVSFLKNKNIKSDIIASEASLIGLVFTIMAMITGMIWAKYNWGTYWNWDPRETSILILLFIYGAYFVLRMSVEREDLKYKLSAAYSIIAFVSVPFLIFIMPRIMSGLHPGAISGANSSPIINGSGGMLDSSLMWSFGVSLLSFTLFFFWLLNIRVRYQLLKFRRKL